MHRQINGLKTLMLFGVMWTMLLALGAGIAGVTRSPSVVWIFAGLGVVATAVSYWNSDKIAIRSMHARP